MGDVVQWPIKFRPRLVHDDRTPVEDLEYALKIAWERQQIVFKDNVFHHLPRLWDDPPDDPAA